MGRKDIPLAVGEGTGKRELFLLNFSVLAAQQVAAVAVLGPRSRQEPSKGWR